MKTWIIVAALLLLAALAIHWLGGGDGAVRSGNPAVAMIGNDLQFKSQAEVTLRLTTLANSMKQQMAAGSVDALAAKPTLDDLDRLHAEIEDSKRQLITLGDSPAQVEDWLRRLQWDEFQRVEQQFRRAAAPSN